MHRARRFSGVALAMALLTALALAASTGAQELQSAGVQLTQSRGSGVSGTASEEHKSELQ